MKAVALYLGKIAIFAIAFIASTFACGLVAARLSTKLYILLPVFMILIVAMQRPLFALERRLGIMSVQRQAWEERRAKKRTKP